jgi:hypothetical protein
MAIGQSIASCMQIFPFAMNRAFIKGAGDANVACSVNQQQFPLTTHQNLEEVVFHLVARGVDDHLETCSQVIGDLQDHHLNDLAVQVAKAFLSTEVDQMEAPSWYKVSLETADKAMSKADGAKVASRKRRAESQLQVVAENPLAQALRSYNNNNQQQLVAVAVANAVANVNAGHA